VSACTGFYLVGAIALTIALSPMLLHDILNTRCLLTVRDLHNRKLLGGIEDSTIPVIMRRSIRIDKDFFERGLSFADMCLGIEGGKSLVLQNVLRLGGRLRKPFLDLTTAPTARERGEVLEVDSATQQRVEDAADLAVQFEKLKS